MCKVSYTCLRCGESFLVYPSRVRDQAARGIEIKFCSRACTDAARAEGKIGSRKRQGREVPCNICGTLTYRKQNKLRRQEFHFCSETCRVEAQRRKLLDRSGSKSGAWKKLNGAVITCVICGHKKYQKQSYIDRRAAMTCGKNECKSAYGRSLWSLPPFSSEEKNRSGMRRRRTNFTAKQRVEWLDDCCARCGTKTNLSLDHILAVCNGGESTRENAQTLCQPCNNWKSKNVDMPLARGREQLRKAA